MNELVGCLFSSYMERALQTAMKVSFRTTNLME